MEYNSKTDTIISSKLEELRKDIKNNEVREFTIDDLKISFDEIKDDYFLLSSIYSNEIFKEKVDDDNCSITFIIEFLLEKQVNQTIIDVIKDFKYDEIIYSENSINLPYGLYFEFNKNRIDVRFYCFWMKKKYTELTNKIKTELVEKTNNLSEPFIYSLTEILKESINDPNNEVLLSWLMKAKEENLAEKKSLKFLKNKSNYIKNITSISISELHIDNEEYYKENLLESTYNVEEDESKSENKINTNEMIDRLNSITKKKKPSKNTKNTQKEKDILDENHYSNNNDEYNLFIEAGGKAGDTIHDRKSIFQAHAIRISSIQQVDKYSKMLKTHKKIAKATHNIYAYRLKEGKYTTSAFDDDGETRAGERLLELLKNMNVDNIFVMVSRWFGGIQLGADRFKHINDSAKILITSNKEYFNFK